MKKTILMLQGCVSVRALTAQELLAVLAEFAGLSDSAATAAVDDLFWLVWGGASLTYLPSDRDVFEHKLQG